MWKGRETGNTHGKEARQEDNLKEWKGKGDKKRREK
jgi:hypothetical protein